MLETLVDGGADSRQIANRPFFIPAQ